MTIFYPDISGFQAGISVAGATAVCVKVSEGSTYINPDFTPALARAKADGVFAFGYHFLHAGNVSGQASWCHSHAGDTPLMIDMEQTTGSTPTVADAAGFMDAYRALGGKVTLCYIPHWYWAQIGSPSLTPLDSLGLVSSDYTSYSDSSTAAGWLPYGGVTPVVWQYTDAGLLSGVALDYNAYRGTLAEFETLVSGAVAPPVPPPPPPSSAPVFPYPSSGYLGQPSSDENCHSGYFGGVDNVNVHTWQERMYRRGWTIAMDGRYGPVSEATCRSFQGEKGLSADGLVGPVTWSASWTAPVT